MANPVIVIPDYLTECAIEREVFGHQATIRLLGAVSESEIIDSIADAEVILLYHDISLTSASIVKMTDCKIIVDRKSTRLNSSHIPLSRMPSSA